MRAQRLVPAGLTGLVGIACAACCVIPLLLVAGVLSSAGWAAAGVARAGDADSWQRRWAVADSSDALSV